MTTYRIDDVDRQILNLLQKDARYTAIELAERVGVSDNTIHNRMGRLEEEGVITGYTARVDHNRTGLSLFFLFICTARVSERSDVADAVLALPQVVEVTEVMSGEENLLVKVYGAEDEDITHVAEELDGLALRVNDEKLIKVEHSQPLDYVEVEDIVSLEE